MHACSGFAGQLLNEQARSRYTIWSIHDCRDQFVESPGYQGARVAGLPHVLFALRCSIHRSKRP